jgi:hypothetical protein
MRTKTSATYIILLVLVCFAAGVLSIVLRPDQLLDGLLSLATPAQTPTDEAIEEDLPIEIDNELITILIMGVDHIADPEGKLLAVWLLTFKPGEKHLAFLGLPLDLPLSEDQPSLGESFDLWDPPEYGAGFINQLSVFAPSPIRGFVALDEHGFAALLDYFGGVDLDNQLLTGSSVIGSLRLTYGNPLAALKLQARVLESLRNRVGQIGVTPELTPLTSLSPIHAYTSPSPPELATLAIPLLPLEPENITILTYSTNENSQE